MPSDRAAQFTALTDDIQAFRNYIQSERGLAGNTLLAYGRDLDRLAQWIAGGGMTSYLTPSLRDLSHYLEFLALRVWPRRASLGTSSPSRCFTAS